MNGELPDSRVQPADPGEPGDSRGSLRETFRVIRAAKAAFEARGEWRLAREIEDAVARWDSEENPPKPFIALGEGERSREGVHGENPQDAEVT